MTNEPDIGAPVTWTPDSRSIITDNYPEDSVSRLGLNGTVNRYHFESLPESLFRQMVKDGKRLVFWQYTNTAHLIHLVDLYSGHSRTINITLDDDTLFELYPRFVSPDWEWIYGEAFHATHLTEIFRMRPDGSDIQNLSNHESYDVDLIMSPDGQWLVFTSGRSGNPDIFRMRPDGSQLENITNHPAHDDLPLFSSDGEWIIFTSHRSNNPLSYRMRIDGSQLEAIDDSTVDFLINSHPIPVINLPLHGEVLLLAGVLMILLPRLHVGYLLQP
jgi:tricorn protease-like protein